MKKDSYNRPILHILLIAVVGTIAYSNTFNASFQFDDIISIKESPVIRDLGYFLDLSKAEEAVGSGSFYYYTLKNRYIGLLSYALNYKFNGLDVTGYHIFNLGVHLINAFLFYLLVLLTFRTPRLERACGEGTIKLVALFSGLLFVSHPLQTQAVTYIAQRVTSIAAMFYLAAVILYIKARLPYQPSVRGTAAASKRTLPAGTYYYAAALLCFILSLKTKEISFTLPAVLLIYELIFLTPGENAKGRLRRGLLLIPFFLLLIIIPLSLAGTDIQLSDLMAEMDRETRIEKSIPRTAYLMTEFRVIVTYLRLFFLPVGQNLDYDYPVYSSFTEPPVFLSFLLLAALMSAGAFMLYRSKKSSGLLKLSAFGIFWLFATLSVESSIIPLNPIFEHRMYLPSIGLIMTVVSLVFTAVERRPSILRPAAALLLAVSFILAAATFERNKVWQSHVSLWEDVVKKSPSKARGYNYLGIAYEETGELDRAIEQYRKCISLDPAYINAYSNLGKAYFEKGLVDSSIEQFKQAIRLDPLHADAHYNLGIAYGAKGMNGLAYREMKLGMSLSGK